MMDSNDRLHNTPIYVGIDVGGTFTDFVVWKNGRLRIHKVPTTPDDQSRAILQGLRDLDLLPVSSTQSPTQSPIASPAESPGLTIVHGMTVATNALLERRGAVTALLTTAGFADALVIGRQNRPHLYRLYQQRSPLLAGDALRLEVDERIDAEGNVLRPLDDEQLAAVAQQLRRGGAESLAIVFLFSYRNPEHEQRAAELLQDLLPELPISLSSDVLPEYREYERTATTLINAYVQPLVARYLARLEQALEGAPVRALRIMQSNGGVIDLRQAAAHAARLVLSGPAGGAVGAFAVASADEGAGTGSEPAQILTFDMGGTSTDVCLCPGRIPTTGESMIGGLPLRLPMIDIHTVGAGGGSIAFVDAGGALQVGPRSAGALPGPACYGRGGTLPTVTDANLVLGRLAVEGFLGGSGQVRLDAAAARGALEELGAQLGLSVEEAALGVVLVANATMERALRAVSVEQGYDPRQFMLLPFGGAGPVHACDLADALGIRRILCPAMPGVLSAYGMLVADMSTEYATSVLCPAADLVAEPSALSAAVAQLEARTRATLAVDASADARTTAALDMRYRGQSYELTVPLALPLSAANLESAVDAFHRAHAQRYGYAMPAEAVEAVTLRIRSSSPGSQVSPPRRPLSGADASAARLGDRMVWFDMHGPVAAACYQREQLEPGNVIAGPALVLQYDSTILLAPGWTAGVDVFGNLLCEKRETHA